MNLQHRYDHHHDHYDDHHHRGLLSKWMASTGFWRTLPRWMTVRAAQLFKTKPSEQLNIIIINITIAMQRLIIMVNMGPTIVIMSMVMIMIMMRRTKSCLINISFCAAWWWWIWWRWCCWRWWSGGWSLASQPSASVRDQSDVWSLPSSHTSAMQCTPLYYNALCSDTLRRNRSVSFCTMMHSVALHGFHNSVQHCIV